jgi:hypothetical protein
MKEATEFKMSKLIIPILIVVLRQEFREHEAMVGKYVASL